MKIKITCLLLLIINFSFFAQSTKRITLINAQTELPVANANILNKTLDTGTTSDNGGKFQIKGNASDSIIITHINYDKAVFSFEELPTVMYLQSSENALNQVKIVGESKRVSSVNRLPVKNIDLPTTTNSVSQKIIEQRNPTDLGDAVKSATGVRPINRYGGFQTFRIRGFNNFVLLIDGVRDERHNLSTSAPTTNLANVERIEVLKGPASVLFGHSALGGIINIVRKKPTDFQTGNFNATYGSFDTYNMSAGIGGPISKKLQYRADFGVTRSNGWRDNGVVTNNGSFMLDYQPTKDDRIEVYLQANNDQYDTDTGIPVDNDGSLVAGMDPETRYNDPQDFLKHKRFDIQLKYNHRFNDKLNLTNHFSWSDDDINYLSTEFLEFNVTKDSLTRAFPFYFNHKTSTIQNQLDLSYSFETGVVEHKSLFGYNLSILDRRSFRGNVIGPGATTDDDPITIPIQNPILNQGFIEPVDNRVNVREELVNAFYVQDWMKFTNQLKALIGIRYDIFSGTYYTDDINPDRTLLMANERTKIPSTALTYRVGLVYQPLETVSLFTSYSNYFKPSRSFAPNNVVFDPEEGFQAEVGVKWEKSNVISATLSGFYMVKNNIVQGSGIDIEQIGEADSKGIEADIQYMPTQGLNIKAGYAYADARVTEDTNKELVGKKLRFAPEHLVNAWVSYDLQKESVKGLGFGSGINITSANYTNSANTFELPSYYTWDATVYYSTKNGIRLALNLNNITDQLYFTDAIYGNQFFPGMERNFKLSLGYKF